MLNKALAVFSLAALMAVPAQAVTFDFTGGANHMTTSHHFDAGGIGLDVTAGFFNGDSITEYQQTAAVGHYDAGLGLDYGSDEHYVDGEGRNDVLIFRFDQEVTLNSITFGYWDSNDQFTLFTYEGGWDNVGENFGNSGSFYYTFSFGPGVDGSAFGIGAYDDNDEFKIRSLNVTAAIPEPATWLMMIMGFGLVGLAARRRTALAAA